MLTIWLTGVSGAGKTTIADAVAREFESDGRVAGVLDGDALRKGLSSDLGLSREDRSEQARRTAHVAALFAQAGVIAIVALVSPYADDRERARQIHSELGIAFFEVWVDTPISICAERDVKGLYAKSRAGTLHGLTGVDAVYEEPVSPDLRVSGYDVTPEEIARDIIAHVGAVAGR